MASNEHSREESEKKQKSVPASQRRVEATLDLVASVGGTSVLVIAEEWRELTADDLAARVSGTHVAVVAFYRFVEATLNWVARVDGTLVFIYQQQLACRT